MALLADVLSPDSLEGFHAAGSFDVTNNVDGDHWRSLDDGDCLDNLLLVVLGARAVHLVSSHILSYQYGQTWATQTNTYEHKL